MEQKKTNKMGSRMNANLPALILVAVYMAGSGYGD